MFFFIIDWLLFYRQTHRHNKKPSVIFGGYLRIFVQNENFNLTSPTEAPIENLKILIFNILS
jgi:hypothetical protein